MSEHRIDPVSLVSAIVFLSLGVVGLARGIGWIEEGAGLWAVILVVAGIGTVGAFAAIRGLVRADNP